MLSDFFRINMPYGIKRRNENSDEWYAFNREYSPIGFNNDEYKSRLPDLPIYTQYKDLTESKLLKLASHLERFDNGEISQIWLYEHASMNDKEWNLYFEKIKILSGLQTKNQRAIIDTKGYKIKTKFKLSENETDYLTDEELVKSGLIKDEYMFHRYKMIAFLENDIKKGQEVPQKGQEPIFEARDETKWKLLSIVKDKETKTITVGMCPIN